MSVARIALVGTGALAIAFGVVLVLTTQRFDQIVSLAAWLAAAVVVHDGVVAPATSLTTRGLDAVGRRLSRRSLAVVRTAWATGACLTLLAVPLVVAQARGPRNASVLAGDYARDLALVWCAVVAVTVLVAVLHVVRARRTRDLHPSTDR